ncbi:MAG: heat shock protein transcriptional repressor HspR [Acidimicrobiia bacterium]
MAKDREEAVYIISVAAELAGIHPQTLRIYERRGLLKPYRTPGGTRRYSEADLERLALIQELTSEGVNIEGAKRILAMEEEIDRLNKRVGRLRRLLGEVEKRFHWPQQAREERVHGVTVTGRNLPDLPRPDLQDLFEE